jgi:hypothetical protein
MDTKRSLYELTRVDCAARATVIYRTTDLSHTHARLPLLGQCDTVAPVCHIFYIPHLCADFLTRARARMCVCARCTSIQMGLCIYAPVTDRV